MQFIRSCSGRVHHATLRISRVLPSIGRAVDEYRRTRVDKWFLGSECRPHGVDDEHGRVSVMPVVFLGSARELMKHRRGGSAVEISLTLWSGDHRTRPNGCAHPSSMTDVLH